MSPPRLVVLLLGMQDSALQIERGLQERRAIDRVGCCPCRCKRRSRFWKVDRGMVNAGLEEVDFGQDHLVVESLELAEERLDQGGRLAVVARVDEAGV